MPNVFIYDEFGPEATAMLQALYSRSSASVVEHAERVSKVGSAKFMESYYVGYGHASIGDCGVTTIFLEDISIIAAKAIEDTPLFSGQETSTRYIDFSKQRLNDPLKSSISSSIQNDWIDFYLRSLEPTQKYLAEQFPLKENQEKSIWEKAIKARAFDILRGFLPAGVTTQVAWTTSLRHAHEKLLELEKHPLEEVRDLAKICRYKLSQKYPSSFTHKMRPEFDAYLTRFSSSIAYKQTELSNEKIPFTAETSVNNEVLNNFFLSEITTRPKGALLPRYVGEVGSYKCQFTLDYGSFRDLQRHRNGICRLPLLTTKFGFNPWYLENLPPSLFESAVHLISVQTKRINDLISNGNELLSVSQYYTALGFDVPCELIYDLRQMVYVTELRSSKTVHPTLRNIAIEMHHFLQRMHPELLLYTDLDTDDFDVRRGSQDIVRVKDYV
jgi:thymidylate synthase ThyX